MEELNFVPRNFYFFENIKLKLYFSVYKKIIINIYIYNIYIYIYII